MTEQDPLDRLDGANPFPRGTAAEPTPRISFDAQLEDIVMNKSRTGPSEETPAASSLARGSQSWLPRMAVLFAAVVAMAGGLVVANTLRSTGPAAAVQRAALAASEHDSGKILVTASINEAEADSEAGTGWTEEYRFDGDNSHMVLALDTGETLQEVIRIGGQIYYRSVDETESESFYLTTADQIDPQLVKFDPENSKPQNILPLLQQTDDFNEVSSEGNRTTFSGSVSRSTLADLKPEEVPAGLAMIVTANETETLPENVTVEVVVEDERLVRMTIAAKGESQEGYIDGTITTSFVQWGEPQSIVAPSEDQVITGQTDYEVERAYMSQVLSNFEEANPGICRTEREVIANNLDGQENLRLAEVEDIDAYVACLRAEASDPEVVEAAAIMHLE